MADAIKAHAAYKAAQKLSDHFALRNWHDMASDRGDLRRKVRDKGFDPNEPTRDDCLEAFRDALAVYLTTTNAALGGREGER